MRYIKIFGALLLTAVLTGCMEEKGNYDYISAEQVLPVTVKGLPEKEVVFDYATEVKLTPILEGLPKSESEYDFTWYSYLNGGVAIIPVRDTISKEKDLEFMVKYTPGVQRMLVFVIKDKKTQVCSITEILMNVSSIPMGTGYYIAKDIDGMTDVDYISESGVQYSDLLELYLGRKLVGEAVKTAYQAGQYTQVTANEDGTVTTINNQKAFHVLSTHDAITLNAGTFELFKNFEDMFYGPVKVVRPSDFFYGSFSSGVYFMNAGNIHSIYLMGLQSGIYGDSRTWSDNDADPVLYPKFLPCDYPGSVLCFDVNRRSFCYTTMASTRIDPLNAPPSGKEDLPLTNNMNMDVVDLLDRSTTNTHQGGFPAWAIMKSVSQPYKYYLADIKHTGAQYPFIDFDELGANRQLPLADVFAAHRQTNAIYFAKGNKISYYVKNEDDDDSYEENITFQAGQLTEGEQVVYMNHIYPGTGDLAVLTNKGGNWKLYLFPTFSGTQRLDVENAKVYSGTGNARHMMKR